MAGMRREMYDDAHVQSRTEHRRISPLRTSTAIGGSALALPSAVAEKSALDASQALKNLSLSMQKFQAGSDAADRRHFFLHYLHKEIGSLRYAIAQDALNNLKAPSNVSRIMVTAEGEKGAYNRAKSGYGYGNGDNTNFQNKPQYPCPLPFNHKVAYGCASYCANFQKDTKPVRIDKVKKYKMCKKCLKKGTTHTIDQC